MKSWNLLFSVVLFAACSSLVQKPATQPTPAQPIAPPQAIQKPKAEDAGTPNLAKLSCNRGNEIRVVEIVKQGNGCTVNYTKGGKTTSVASSAKGLKHCEDSQKKIQAHLEGAGFKCN